MRSCEELQVFQREILQDIKCPRQLIILHVPITEKVGKKEISLGKQGQKNNITKSMKDENIQCSQRCQAFH